jgi:predicted nucleic acid-binding protein
MHRTIIADTSCFIVLTNIGELDLLQRVYGEIMTTVEVAKEYGEKLPSWVEIVGVKDKDKQKILEIQVDKGEASALALALESPDSTIIIDDYKARKLAEKLELRYTGTIGVVIKAKLKGVIPSIKPLLYKIKSTTFRLTDEVERQALKEAGESS